MAVKPKGAFKPGKPARASAQVKIPGSSVEKTVVEGEPMSPTDRPG